jgi:hypothetical protein
MQDCILIGDKMECWTFFNLKKKREGAEAQKGGNELVCERIKRI